MYNVINENNYVSRTVESLRSSQFKLRKLIILDVMNILKNLCIFKL